ncbi:lipopolysaccharide biosynthesis protein [Shinella curvata]|uniref:Lipopolysaccharide biosynthesis protein n=1 Tax=Shinella curvata TaxID=1817964 RepID=A0ABT8XI90_9HYPH|nr:lipopolysaccharide biosynthesis protein [Shinella curvata]MCJ8055942.1 lipopolysaccharide biosynthesis protein [Shinella curvata]MDO6123457.1 lipopolysaccharide biosynthesis protein [Shinella curvata]
MSKGDRLPIRTLLGHGAAAGVIKLASASLTFLLFVAAAVVTDERQFGLFSTAYAGASLVSFFSIVGQHAVVMRFWPQYAGVGDIASANGVMARAIRLTIFGLSVSTLLVLVVGMPSVEGVPEWRPLVFATATLTFALGWSEFTACALRARGNLFGGLSPRDITWRVVTIVAFAISGLFAASLSAVAATMLAAGLLLLCVLPQTVVLLRDTRREPRGPLTKPQEAEFKAVTLSLWGVTALPPALAQASTLLVAAILGPEAAGGIFVADRIMRLAVLALNGINQALAPQISGTFHRGEREHVQRLTGFAAIGGFALALAMFIVFVLFGRPILAIFDPAYATGTLHGVLIILGLGALIGTACGPTELTMQLTGLQKELFRTLIAVNTLGLAAMAGLTLSLGPIGAALGMAGTMAVWCVTGAATTRRRIGIDPSIFGFFAGQDAAAVRLILKGRS